VVEENEVKLPLSLIRGDGDIAAAAISRLAWDASIPENAIKVTVEKGWVKLTGEVAWRFEQEAAAKDVRSLFGVIGVTNDISIKSRVNTAHISSDITKALHRAWLDESHVKVTAEGGKVTLTGRVDSWSDRKIAGATAWAAPGTTSVANDLMIA